MSGQRFATAGCALLASCGLASAFYPPPSLIDRPVTVLPPPVLPSAPPGTLTPVPPVPPVPPPEIIRPPTPVIPQENPNPPRPTVPEPASFVVAATGLAALAVRRARRR